MSEAFSLIPPKERIAARTYPDLSRYAVDLFSRVQKRAEDSAELIDFGGTALDVGSRDGRYVSVIRALGPKKIIAIDPSKTELQKGVNFGLLRPDEIVQGTLQEYANRRATQADSAFIFNVNPDLPNSDTFINALIRLVKPGGLIVASFAERSTWMSFLESVHYRSGKKLAVIMQKPAIYVRSRSTGQKIDYGGGPNHFISFFRRTNKQ